VSFERFQKRLQARRGLAATQVAFGALAAKVKEDVRHRKMVPPSSY
jgi:hypothetical protein